MKLLQARKSFKSFPSVRKRKNHITQSAFTHRELFCSKAIRATLDVWRFEAIPSPDSRRVCPASMSFRELLRRWQRSILFVNNNWIFVRTLCDKFISSVISLSPSVSHISETKGILRAAWPHHKRDAKNNTIRMGSTHNKLLRRLL